ncbi:MAG: hypothetical protein ABI759_13250 [Candidatus Solibacter sp.]
MLFQPAIIALLLASAANVAMLLGIAPFAIDVIRHWDIASGSQRQLALERCTYLVSALLSGVLATQLLAVLLFVFNADKMASMFVGAMCAAGALNVNEYGFPALIAQVAVFFLAAMWLAINHVDIQAPDYPLVRVKYALLLGMGPVLAATFALQLRYFLGLKADVLTSCCARVFSGDAKGLPGDLAALPPVPAMIAFYGALLLAMAASTYTAVRGRGGYLVALASLVAFVVAIAGILSFLSLYVYEHPHHHCPFCVLKAEYGYQGYWLYVPLFVATACGLGAGAVQPFAGIASLREIVPLASARLSTVALAGLALIAVIATVIILHSNLILIDHRSAHLSLPGNPL